MLILVMLLAIFVVGPLSTALGGVDVPRWFRISLLFVAIIELPCCFVILLATGLGDPPVGPDGHRHKSFEQLLIVSLSFAAFVLSFWQMIEFVVTRAWRREFQIHAKSWRLVATRAMLIVRLTVIALPFAVTLASIDSRGLTQANATIAWVVGLILAFLVVPGIAPATLAAIAIVRWVRMPKARMSAVL